MKNVFRPRRFALILTVVATLGAAWIAGCDLTHIDEGIDVPLRDHLAALHSATDVSEAEAALRGLLNKTRIGRAHVDPTDRSVYASYIIGGDEIRAIAAAHAAFVRGDQARGQTFREVFEGVVAAQEQAREIMSQTPVTPVLDQQIRVSAEEALELFRISASVALNEPEHFMGALLVAATARGGELPSAIPALTPETVLSPAQQLLVRVWLDAHGPSLMPFLAADSEARGGGGGGGADCKKKLSCPGQHHGGKIEVELLEVDGRTYTFRVRFVDGGCSKKLAWVAFEMNGYSGSPTSGTYTDHEGRSWNVQYGTSGLFGYSKKAIKYYGCSGNGCDIRGSGDTIVFDVVVPDGASLTGVFKLDLQEHSTTGAVNLDRCPPPPPPPACCVDAHGNPLRADPFIVTLQYTGETSLSNVQFKDDKGSLLGVFLGSTLDPGESIALLLYDLTGPAVGRIRILSNGTEVANLPADCGLGVYDGAVDDHFFVTGLLLTTGRVCENLNLCVNACRCALQACLASHHKPDAWCYEKYRNCDQDCHDQGGGSHP